MNGVVAIGDETLEFELARIGYGWIITLKDSSQKHHLKPIADHLQRALKPRDLVPAFESLGLLFETTKIPTIEEVSLVLKSFNGDQNNVGQSAITHHIGVCYDPEFGLDMGEVSQKTGISFDEIIAIHTGVEYTVEMIGFLPGFPYLSGLNPKLHVPRLVVPRKSVTPLSVAIAGVQTGIYPQESPGGWHILGRTRFELFDVDEDPPAKLRAGDRVRFYAISREEYLDI